MVVDGMTSSVDSNILYCPSVGAPCIDESLTDSTLATHVQGQNGRVVTRRIKHFSGYVVTNYADAMGDLFAY
jgi:hypothetical protein